MRKIVKDKKILRQVSKEWRVGTFEELGEIVDNMKEVMDELDGVGIAAIQIGIPKRIFLAGKGDDTKLFVNAKILERSPFEKKHWEGCLSCDNVQVRTSRPSYVVIQYDTVAKGAWVRMKEKYKGHDAAVIMHEFDHMNGYLIEDRGKVYKP